MISIRPAREDEAAFLAVIGLRAWENATSTIGVTDALRENASNAFQNFTRSSWLSINVAELDGVIAGWSAREHFDEAISDFWVDPAYQRQGVGAALLEDLERQVVNQGFEMIKLESHAQNSQAVAFFQKHGYGVNWLSITYSPKLDRDVQSVGLQKQLVEDSVGTYGPDF